MASEMTGISKSTYEMKEFGCVKRVKFVIEIFNEHYPAYGVTAEVDEPNERFTISGPNMSAVIKSSNYLYIAMFKDATLRHPSYLKDVADVEGPDLAKDEDFEIPIPNDHRVSPVSGGPFQYIFKP